MGTPPTAGAGEHAAAFADKGPSFVKWVRHTVSLMRCHQWIKNTFVFAAPLFAKKLTEPEYILATVLTFFAFCFVASAVYILNDLADIERDRAHPKKRFRALAAGYVTPAYARTLMALLVIGGLALSYFGGGAATVLILAIYAATNILYSYVLKFIVILDVAYIAVGFILRILAGAYATDTIPSYWLILCTLNVSLFLGFAKRRGEVVALGDEAQNTREVLQHYSIGFLDQMMSIVTTSTLICYILYTVDDNTRNYFGTRALVLTVPFVMYGIFRYLYLTYHRGEGGSPTRTILMDPIFLLNGVLWAAACVVVIYWWPEVREILW
jgi:4-hydroxybenzoate polyprenyltransferase